jgi:hypothetical protein
MSERLRAVAWGGGLWLGVGAVAGAAGLGDGLGRWLGAMAGAVYGLPRLFWLDALGRKYLTISKIRKILPPREFKCEMQLFRQSWLMF